MEMEPLGFASVLEYERRMYSARSEAPGHLAPVPRQARSRFTDSRPVPDNAPENVPEQPAPFIRPSPATAKPPAAAPQAGVGQQLPGLDPRPPQWAEDIRKFYDDAAKEPVPDELKALMDALARQIEPPGDET